MCSPACGPFRLAGEGRAERGDIRHRSGIRSAADRDWFGIGAGQAVIGRVQGPDDKRFAGQVQRRDVLFDRDFGAQTGGCFAHLPLQFPERAGYGIPDVGGQNSAVLFEVQAAGVEGQRAGRVAPGDMKAGAMPVVSDRHCNNGQRDG